MFFFFLRWKIRSRMPGAVLLTLYNLQLSREQPVLDPPPPPPTTPNLIASLKTVPVIKDPSHTLASNCPGSMDGHSKSRGMPFISEHLTTTADQRDAM